MLRPPAQLKVPSAQPDNPSSAFMQTAHVPFAPDQPRVKKKPVLPPRPLTPRPAVLQPPPNIVSEYLPLDRSKVPDAIKTYIGKNKELDRSQMQIIKKINLYIDAANAVIKELYPNPVEYKKHVKEKLKETGHCHGFNLYRGYLQDHGALKDYDDMVDMIINCPVERLLQADHIFEVFYPNILRGQKPEVYLDAKYDQQNIDEILGTRVSYHEAKGEGFTKASLTTKLQKLLTPHSRAILVSKVECADKPLVSHSVSLSTDGKKGVDYFDPNFKSGASVRIQNYEHLMRQVWFSCFSSFGIVALDELNLRISVLHNACQPVAPLLSAAAHALKWTSPSPQPSSPDSMSAPTPKQNIGLVNGK